jgi:hypothetical protein
MLKTSLDLSPEDLRLLHQMYFQAYLFAKYYGVITIDDERGRMSFLPMSEEELNESNKLRFRAFRAMDKTYSALPADHPDVIANEDVAELWTPYPDQLIEINKLLDT